MTDDELGVQFATYAERNLDWPRRTIFRRSANALVAIGQALLAIHVELRRLDSARSQWYREVLGVLTAAKDGDGSLRSGQPAAAPGCQVCGNPGAVTRCVVGPLTAEQWQAHKAWLYQEWRDNGKTKSAAQARATDTMLEYFGPCPEES